MRDEILKRCIPEPNSGCWLWLGTVHSLTGYGYVSCGRRRTQRLAHRVSYEVFIGVIPQGLHIDHLCRNRICVNPTHLQAVTQTTNNQRQQHRGFKGRHHVPRLNVDDVRAIRAASSTGERERDIARRTNINESTVRDIVRGRTWRNVS